MMAAQLIQFSAGVTTVLPPVSQNQPVHLFGVSILKVRKSSYNTAKFESPPARGSKTQQVSPFCNQQEFKKTETSPLPDPGTAPSTIRNSGLFLSFRKNYVKAVRK
jgi:hypothetical protein